MLSEDSTAEVSDLLTPFEQPWERRLSQALATYEGGRLLLRFVGDRGVEQLSDDPLQAEAQIKSLLDQGYSLREGADKDFYLSRGLPGGMMAETPIAVLEKKLDMKPDGKLSVFITYQWAQKEIALAVHKAFEAKGFLVIRDEDTLHNGVYIQQFMKIITHPKLDYVLPIISASYLKSQNCMYEVNQIMKRHHWESSLLPYVVNCDPLADARIYSGVASFEDYWQEQLTTPEGQRNQQLIENILRNIRPFTEVIRTRIQIPEATLIASGYQGLFETVAQREATREGIRFKAIEELLRVASANEKKKKHDKAKESFEAAVSKLDEMEHLDGIDDISAKVYGLYGEYLLRQNETAAGKEQLEIAANFGYQPAMEEKRQAEEEAARKAELLQKTEAELARKVAEIRLAEEALQKEKAKHQAEVEARQKAEMEAKRGAEAERKVEEARKQAELTKQKAEPTPPRPDNVLLFRSPQPNHQELTQFLRLVAEGEQDQCEAMLEKNKDLVLFSGNVKDLSGRTFENITGFQYAVWALDWHMWTMLRKYLPDEAAAQQLSMTGSWVSQYGLHAGVSGGPLDKLATVLKTYIDNYSPWTIEQCKQHWQKQVGGAQLWLPAHVINEYCRPDRSFVPCPSFTEPTLPRTRKIDEGEWFTASYNGGKLGDKFGVLRYKFLQAECARVTGGGAGGPGVTADHAACVSLTKVRVQQRDQLISDLSIDQQHAAQRRLRM